MAEVGEEETGEGVVEGRIDCKAKRVHGVEGERVMFNTSSLGRQVSENGLCARCRSWLACWQQRTQVGAPLEGMDVFAESARRSASLCGFAVYGCVFQGQPLGCVLPQCRVGACWPLLVYLFWKCHTLPHEKLDAELGASAAGIGASVQKVQELPRCDNRGERQGCQTSGRVRASVGSLCCLAAGKVSAAVLETQMACSF